MPVFKSHTKEQDHNTQCCPAGKEANGNANFEQQLVNG